MLFRALVIATLILSPSLLYSQTVVINATTVEFEAASIEYNSATAVKNSLILLFPTTAVDGTGIPTYKLPAGKPAGVPIANGFVKVKVDMPLNSINPGAYKVCMKLVNDSGESPCSAFAGEWFLRLVEPTAPVNVKLGAS